MPTDHGAEIARRALELVGAPFRLHGRNVEAGLDCVGVVARAMDIQSYDVPCDYALRGNHLERVSAFLDRRGFSVINGTTHAGDILLCRPGPGQLHFAIATNEGAVHAHAGLRRAVLTPSPLPWPIIGHWRATGD